jgi:hypothetical protein
MSEVGFQRPDKNTTLYLTSELWCLNSDWWAWVDSNYRPHAYQACALTGLSYRPINRYQGSDVRDQGAGAQAQAAESDFEKEAKAAAPVV